ncbi:MAG: peptidoglycan recognition protein [Egibacteraceae bacterium]
MRGRVAGVLLLAALIVGLLPPLSATGSELVPRLRHVVMEGLPAAVTGEAGLSQQVLAPAAFSLVGVSVPEGTRVLLRTGDAAGVWSPWVETEALADDGDGPEPGSHEAAEARPGWERMSEPLWVGEASHLQVRVLGGDPGDVAVHLVDSLGLSRSLLQRFVDAWRAPWRAAGITEAQASTRPPIVTRAQWGADESRRRGNPAHSASTRAGILHHTAGSNDYTPEQAPGIVRAIYAYHTGALGWSDIGYNLLVDRFGTIYEGRAGGLEQGVIGAHAGGFNTETFGISIIGTFMSALPPGPARSAAVSAIAWKFQQHGINADPNATVDIVSRGSTRYPQGATARMHTLSAHRDVSATACPGDALYAHMGELRQQVYAGVPPPPPVPVPPPRRLLPDLPGMLPELDLPLTDADLPVTPPTVPPAVSERRPTMRLRDLVPW